MAQKSIQSNKDLAQKIKLRRKELNLTIEEAASRADVGTKTWSRYEAGEAIRTDKIRGVCKALNWKTLPDIEDEEEFFTVDRFKKHEAWSTYLEENFGQWAAFSFAAGSDVVLDHINQDLEEISSMPAGTHIGQLSMSWLEYDLPDQFLTQYTYEFLYQMKCALLILRLHARSGVSMIANSVLDELLIYLCNQESLTLLELGCNIPHDENDEYYCEDWIYDLFGQDDLLFNLYSDSFLEKDHSYHFSHWADPIYSAY